MAWYVYSPRSWTMIFLSSSFDLYRNWICKATSINEIRKLFRSIKHSSSTYDSYTRPKIRTITWITHSHQTIVDAALDQDKIMIW